jgi:hypothetical protein
MTWTPPDQPGPAAGEAPRPAPRGDADFRIARDGTWFYLGSPIARMRLVKLFASVLQRDSGGAYWLRTPVESVRVEVDDAPFVAVALEAEGAGRAQRLHFRTNLDERVCADATHPIRVRTDARTGAPAPYVGVRAGLEALIARSVFYQLVDVAEPDSGGHMLGVWSAGTWFPLGPAEETT